MKRYIAAVSIAISFASLLIADDRANGPTGINAKGLKDANNQPLLGTNIFIGQIELARPGMNPLDDAAHRNSTINPTKVFTRGGAANHNDNTQADESTTLAGEHAEEVASVMISTDSIATGVATGAKLYAGQFVPPNSNNDDAAAVAITTIIKGAVTDGGKIRAMNMSFQNPLLPGNMVDGNQTLTQFIDWSASTDHDDILYVVSNRNMTNGAGVSVPIDNFNGITVAASTLGGPGDVYRQVAPENDFSENSSGDRTFVDIMAPGESIRVTGLNDSSTINSGSSFAAPLVTGTVALLQQYAAQRLQVNAKGWTPDSQHHQVMKAVLMNSANKLIDDGSIMVNGQAVPVGGLLGMDRTVVDLNGNNWLQSPAYDDDAQTGAGTVALDPQMGTGQLDAKRALKQFSAGEFHSIENAGPSHVPAIGWDYGRSTHTGQNNTYIFNQQLQANSFVSATLVFDRVIQFDHDGGTANQFDSGDTFVTSSDIQQPGHDQFSDLDIYLYNVSTGQQIADSISGAGTVDHIFFQVPTTDTYELVVNQFNDHGGIVNYGLAWWTDGVGKLLSDLGDINQDGFIDVADISALMAALADLHNYETDHGFTSNQDLIDVADVNGDGVVNNLDIQAEIALVANTEQGLGSISAVPEPASICLMAFCAVAMLFAKISTSWPSKFSRKESGVIAV